MKKVLVGFSALFFMMGPDIGAHSNPSEVVRVEGLQCEGRENPAGIDVPDPRLTWRLMSDRQGVAQQSYQVVVASRLDLLIETSADIWNSGKVASGQSVHVVYGGKPLISGQRYFWSVRIWDDTGSVSEWSTPAHWIMGLLTSDDWTARWIGLDEGPEPESLDPAHWIWHPDGPSALAKPPGTCFFRRAFTVPEDKTLISARVLMVADNRMAAHVNGKWCGASEDYHSVSEINILSLVRPGANVIAVEATNTGESPNPAGLIGVIQLAFSDGTNQKIPTDPEWRVANQGNPGWNEGGYDDSAWVRSVDLGPMGMDPWSGLILPDTRRLPARMLRHAFELENPIHSAVIHMAGLGLSELYLNGQKVGDEVLSPALSEYEKRVTYVTHDVTQLLKQGANALGVWLGNGRFYAPRGGSFVGMKSYGYPKLLLQMDIQFKNGERRRIISGSGWKITINGPITANNEYDGEEYDARLEIADWTQSGFDDSTWRSAIEVEPPKGVLSAQTIDPIRITETIKPISVSSPERGVHIFDMGQNMVGWVRLKVKGESGTHVALRFTESMRDGHLFFDNLRGAKCRDMYILKGGGDEIFEPRFTYHGFRYVEVRGYPGEPDLSALEGRVVHDDLKPVGAFQCSDETINQIYRNAVWGTRGNYRSIPTDCPQRDERQGWLGDRSEESRGEMYLFDAGRFYAKWIQDMEDSQLDSGSVPDVAPPYYPFYTDNVTWPSSFIIIPGILYEKNADRRVIERHYPAMKRWIDHMLSFMKDGLMPRDQYGDWCMPPESEELIHSNDPNRKTAGTLIATAYFCHDLELMEGYATLLGRTEDAKQFHALSTEMKSAFERAFWNSEKGQYDNGTQTSSVLALFFNLTPSDRKSAVVNHLVNGIMGPGKGHIGTGLIGCQWLMRTLSSNGHADVAYTIATQRDYPSWGYMIDHGATTIWELWNGNTADPGMNSHNHVMLLGDLITWFYESLAGIGSDSGQPGYKKIILKPSLAGKLTHVDASFNSLYGAIVSQWRCEQNSFSWEVVIPPNTAAEIHVPSKDSDAVVESGVAAVQSKRLCFLRHENGASVFAAPAGKYTFQSILF